MAKKDVMYSMRMSRTVRDGLARAAEKECRSVASLLNKIVTDYLTAHGYLDHPVEIREKRRFPRKKVALPARCQMPQSSSHGVHSGVVLDISEGGLRLSYPAGTGPHVSAYEGLPDFAVELQLPHNNRVELRCRTRHIRFSGDELQVGAAFEDGQPQLERLIRYLN